MTDPMDDTLKAGAQYIQAFVTNDLFGMGSVQISTDTKKGLVGALVGVLHPCDNCGEKVFADADYCPFCGHFQEETEEGA